MIDLTPEQISAAAANDLDAISAVLKALEPRIGQLANKYGRNMGQRDTDLIEELQQEGRIAVWQCIGRFEGESTAQFFAYVDRTLKGVMDDNRRTQTRQGVSEDTARRFERCLIECAGDPYAAEAEAVRPDGCLGRERMTPDTAYAARISWQGAEYLDAPAGGRDHGTDHTTLAERLEADGYLAVSADLADASDVERGRRAAIKAQVHATLARLGRQQAFVLRATHGIDPVPPMDTDREMAEALGVADKKVSIPSIRRRGYDRFRDLYLAGATATPDVAA